MNAPTKTTLRFDPQTGSDHFHLCPTCGELHACPEPACKMPKAMRCLECWAAITLSEEPLPGTAFILATLFSGVVLAGTFFYLVFRG